MTAAMNALNYWHEFLDGILKFHMAWWTDIGN